MITFLAGILVLLLITALCFLLPAKRYGSGILVVLAVVVPVLGVLCYVLTGAPQKQWAYWQHVKEVKEAKVYLKTHGSAKGVIAQLHRLLKEQPNRPKGWYLLGNVVFSAGKQAEAVQYYSRAVSLDPDNRDYLMALAGAEMAGGAPLEKGTEVLLKKHLKLVPDDRQWLFLMAMNDFNAHRMEAARKVFEQLLEKVPESSPDAQRLLTLIGKTRAES